MPLGVCLLRVFSFGVSILAAHASDDRDSLGRMQVGHAGPVCSFLRRFLMGRCWPGRNEGHAKSLGGIDSPSVHSALRARREAWQLAALGLGLEEYQAITYDPARMTFTKTH